MACWLPAGECGPFLSSSSHHQWLVGRHLYNSWRRWTWCREDQLIVMHFVTTGHVHSHMDTRTRKIERECTWGADTKINSKNQFIESRIFRGWGNRKRLQCYVTKQLCSDPPERQRVPPDNCLQLHWLTEITKDGILNKAKNYTWPYPLHAVVCKKKIQKFRTMTSPFSSSHHISGSNSQPAGAIFELINSSNAFGLFLLMSTTRGPFQ